MTSRHLVLFDIDGTLLRNAGPHHKEALIAGAMSVTGVGCTLDDVDTAGRLDRDLVRAMLTNAGVSQRQAGRHLTRIISAAEEHYLEHCRVDLSGKVCPGVRDALRLLAERGVPLGLVTGNLSRIAWRKLKNAGIDDHFSFGSFAEQGTTRARLALKAVWEARRKGLAARGCSVTLIGDHANDIAAAQANGYRAIAVATGVMQAEQLQRFKPDLVVHTLEGISVEAICG